MDVHGRPCDPMGLLQAVRKVPDEAAEIDPCQVLRLVEHGVDPGHGAYPVHAVMEHIPGLLVLKVRGLQVEEARDHLEVVLHPVVDLLEEGLLLKEG